jgi:hypothetical protein
MTYHQRLRQLGLEPEPNRIWVPVISQTAAVVLRSERQLKYLSISWERWQPFEGSVNVLAKGDL